MAKSRALFGTPASLEGGQLMKEKTEALRTERPKGYEKVPIMLQGDLPDSSFLKVNTRPTDNRVTEPSDRVSARNREIKLQNTVGIWVQNIVATLVIFSFVGLLFCVLYRDSDLVNKDIFNILLGILGTVVVQIFQYWFGASAGSSGNNSRIRRNS